MLRPERSNFPAAHGSPAGMRAAHERAGAEEFHPMLRTRTRTLAAFGCPTAA